MIRLLRKARYAIKHVVHDLRFWIAGNDGRFYRAIALRNTSAPSESISGLLDRFAQMKQDVQLLQIGANDGMTHDPVYRFIKREHWKAVLLEPQSAVCERYLRPVYRNYPKVSIVNAAIGDRNGSTSLFTISFSDRRWATGLSRFDKDLLLELIRSGRLDRKLKRYGIVPPLKPEDWIAEKQVEVKTFDTVLKEEQVDHVDLLVIDTEGFDHEILKMIDLHHWKPAIIIFEDMHMTEEELAQCHARLHNHGFRTHQRSPNTIAWREEVDEIIVWR